jgi:Lar family restriction alleviation protein
LSVGGSKTWRNLSVIPRPRHPRFWPRMQECDTVLAGAAHGEMKMAQETLVPILKPCPFCGDRPQIVQSGTFAVQCADCGAMGPRAPSMERAAVRWNKRKGDDFGW